jgi:hypothetical protein
VTPRQRQNLLAGVMLALLALTTLWSVNWMFGQQAEAGRARADLDDSQRLAQRIQALRQKPAVAAGEAMAVRQLGRRIEAAAGRAGLDRDALEGLYPQVERPIADTFYVRKPTTIALRGVALPQLASFLYDLTAGSGMTVRDLRLRRPPGASESDRWDAEATVTYLVYQPPADDRAE